LHHFAVALRRSSSIKGWHVYDIDTGLVTTVVDAKGRK
jgi:hypothetical protein